MCKVDFVIDEIFRDSLLVIWMFSFTIYFNDLYFSLSLVTYCMKFESKYYSFLFLINATFIL